MQILFLLNGLYTILLSIWAYDGTVQFNFFLLMRLNITITTSYDLLIINIYYLIYLFFIKLCIFWFYSPCPSSIWLSYSLSSYMPEITINFSSLKLENDLKEKRPKRRLNKIWFVKLVEIFSIFTICDYVIPFLTLFYCLHPWIWRLLPL